MSKSQNNKYFVSLICFQMCLFAAALLSGCATPQGVVFPELEESLVWPKPPDKARIKYVGALSTETDLKKGVTWTEGLGELIFGKKDTGVLVGPYSVTMGSENRLYVADAGSGLIQIFDMETRAYKQFMSIDYGNTLLAPVALDLIDEDVYVVDSALRQVCVFDKDGNFKDSFGDEFLIRPSGIAHWDGNIYVSDTGSHRIAVFNRKGEFIDYIGSRGIAEGEFNFPTHLWVDPQGQLYVSDTLNYRVQIFSSEGKVLKVFGEHGDMPGYFAHPCGIATDSNGNIYVTDRQFENFQIFDPDGNVLMAIGSEGSGYGEFWLPGGIFIDENNRIYIADSFNKRVQVFELLADQSL